MVAHRLGPNSQPSLAVVKRTELTAVTGVPVKCVVSWTAGAGTAFQLLPPLTVSSSSALHGRTLQWRAPSTNPVCADTKLADCASNPFGGGGLPLPGCAEALPAAAASSSKGTAASAIPFPS